MMESSNDGKPYTVLNRKERSRELAQKRRTTYKSLMKELADELPFSKDVISQVDYNSRLRLALCFFRMKSLLPKKNEQKSIEGVVDLSENQSISAYSGLLQDLITESLDGFVLVSSGDGTIIFVSESIHKHLGLFQSEHIGLSIYDLIHEDDFSSVKDSIMNAESRALSGPKGGSVECSFFCQMKCSRFKVSNTATKRPGYKLVFVSGHLKLNGSESSLFTVVRPVNPPSILEITMEGNMFVTHYNMEMKCIFFDGRLRHLMGYEKPDLVSHVPFEFHHHDDVEANLECSRGLMSRGEGLSGYYRYLNKFGEYIWMQSRATMMFDSRTGRPSYIVCMNFIISREKGEKSLELRKALTSKENAIDSTGGHSHDPFPVPREDGKAVNPFTSDENAKEVSCESPMSSTEESQYLSPHQQIEVRSVSPDSTIVIRNKSPESSDRGHNNSSRTMTPDSERGHSNSSRTKTPDSDRGYSSISNDSFKIPAISPAPSFSDSAIGSDYDDVSPPDSVFHHHSMGHMQDIKKETSYSPRSSPLSAGFYFKPQNAHMMPPVNHHVSQNQEMIQQQQPLTHPQFLPNPSQYMGLQQPVLLNMASANNPSTVYIPTESYSMPPHQQLYSHNLVGGFTMHMFPPETNVLPVLNPEDIQFLERQNYKQYH